MEKEIRLHVGCGDRNLDGFINIDISGKPQKKLDVRKGLPYRNNCVDYIFSEHFIEHLSREESIRFLEECYRVLKPGGVCRVATPDLDEVIKSYSQDQWARKEWISRFGYGWIPNKCLMLNVGLRHWGHQHIYNEEDLKMIGNLAGFIIAQRCDVGQSLFEPLKGLEGRADSFVMEFIKESEAYRDALPLVSILIPAYHEKYFREALDSAFNQTYPNTEIIICNDNPSSGIRDIVERIPDRSKVTYVENQKNMGSPPTYIRCFELARGPYIKFLNDDDRLLPDCIKRMVSHFEAFGARVTLVTSKRNRIDVHGKRLKDGGPTSLLVKEDALIHGRDLGNFIVRHFTNVIGEPTTTMFRKGDMAHLSPHILSLDGKECLCLVDFVMWLNLLARGDAVYLTEALSEFRIHKGQDQQKPHVIYKCYAIWPQIIEGARSLGFLEESSDHVEAVQTFSAGCINNQIFDPPQREHISRLCKDLESDLPPLAQQYSSPAQGKQTFPQILDRIQKNQGWHDPLKYVYIRQMC
ncbi:MAG: glycosyltransferase [bacterium]